MHKLNFHVIDRCDLRTCSATIVSPVLRTCGFSYDDVNTQRVVYTASSSWGGVEASRTGRENLATALLSKVQFESRGAPTRKTIIYFTFAGATLYQSTAPTENAIMAKTA